MESKTAFSKKRFSLNLRNIKMEGKSSSNESDLDSLAPPTSLSDADLKELHKRRSIRIADKVSMQDYESALQPPDQKIQKMSTNLDHSINNSKQLELVIETDELMKSIANPSLLIPMISQRGLNKPSTQEQAGFVCFICKEPEPTVRCDPSLKCFNLFHEDCLKKWPVTGLTSCPQHKCHTCIFQNCNRNGILMKCFKCPAAYHGSVCCLPAGSSVLSKTQIICPRHHGRAKPLNIDWCIICGKRGNIVNCKLCSYSFHKKCAKIQDNIDHFVCQSCIAGCLPLNFNIVWTDCSFGCWWPSLVLPDKLIPSEALREKKNPNEFCVRTFGTLEYSWKTCDQVFVFNGTVIDLRRSQKKILDEVYSKALVEARLLHAHLPRLFMLYWPLEPKPYEEISELVPVPPVTMKIDYQLNDACKCSLVDPCGPNSQCLNRSTFLECNDLCPTGNLCMNQGIRRNTKAKLAVILTLNGQGLATMEDLEEGSFVIEYTGELINETERQRRLKEMYDTRQTNFYFHEIAKGIYVDAFKRGNLARFINHSCDPNCSSERIIVDGCARLGIYTTRFIKTVSL